MGRQAAVEKGLPVWRSLLYVPAHVERFVEKAHTRGADAVILDLEDSVPPAEKEAARQRAAEAVRELAGHGVDALVRINSPLRLAVRDLEAVVRPGLVAIAVPKVLGAAHIRLLSAAVAELEAERGIPPGTIGFIGLIETVEALWQVREIAAADPRMMALILGTEDFAAQAGMDPDGEGLLHAKLHLVLAARVAGIIPLGLAASVADFGDAGRLAEVARRSRRLGFEGATCIHPAQVPILNEAFSPSPDEVNQAQKLVEAYEQAVAQGLGALALAGRMVDEPVVRRARRLLEIDRRLRERRHAKRGGALP
ncbi:MAG TPA: CoA ester lyase [Limnochordales bacterium]